MKEKQVIDLNISAVSSLEFKDEQKTKIELCCLGT